MATNVQLTKTFTDIGLLTQRRIVQTFRNPLWLIVSFSTPVLYLALFTPLLKGFSPGHPTNGQVLGSFLPGILAFLAFINGSSMGFGTIFELQSGLIERLRVTPASRLAILLGPILAGLVGMFIFDLVVLIIGWAFGFHIHWGGLLVLAVLLSILMIMFAAFSIAVALLAKEISSFAALINGINLPVLLLAGVLLPIGFGPDVATRARPPEPAVLPDRKRPLSGRRSRRYASGGPRLRRARAAVRAHPRWATGVFRKAVA